MNIGIDARMYGPRVGGGGIGRYVEELVTQLQAIDTQNRYVLFLKKENFDACTITNPRFEKQLADAHWYTLEEQWRMRKIIDREKLDIVHIPHFNVPLFLRTPFVVTIHDLILLDEPYSSKISTRHPIFFALKYWAYKIVLSHALMRAKAIIAISHTVAQSILRHVERVPTARLHIIPNGLTALPSPEETRPVDSPYLLYAGNAFPHKNLSVLLEAFSLTRPLFPNLRLVLAGSSSIFYDRLRKEANDHVIFINHPTDQELSTLYKHAEAFIFPSRIEGFGLPPLEAMSLGTPVIASRIPALEETLGDAAHYFDPSSAADLARKISRLLTDTSLRNNLIAKGTERITHFHWSASARDAHTLYLSCGKKGS